MAHEIFVDTGGFYSLLVRRDDRHEVAARVLHGAAREKRGFVTTEYVLDEVATLLKSRGHGYLLRGFFEMVFASNACQVEWMDAERFHAASEYFLKHTDQQWSFTDCVSFRVMKFRRLRDALTKDKHFEQAGFVALLK
jgi:predicted nucleic acid-binding protein